MRLGENLTVVLHQTRSPENLGSVARVMANFGFSRLIMSEPNLGSFDGAQRLAVKADTVLAGVTVVDSLPEALKDCVWAVGTTSRNPLKGRTVFSPEEAIARLVKESARGPVALVLGGEQRGLSDEELACCPDVLAIPTSELQPSMNLAQATTVLLYLCSREGTTVSSPAQAVEPGARLGTLNALSERMRLAMLAAEFLNPQAPQHVLHELEQSLLRSRLTQREAELWLTAFKHLERAAHRGAPK
jgi:tRNA/rRNA methyltransferase